MNYNGPQTEKNVASISFYPRGRTGPNIAKIDNSGYARIIFSNSVIIKYLKRFAIMYKLPVLQRKWDRVDLNYVGKLEKHYYESNS